MGAAIHLPEISEIKLPADCNFILNFESTFCNAKQIGYFEFVLCSSKRCCVVRLASLRIWAFGPYP